MKTVMKFESIGIFVIAIMAIFLCTPVALAGTETQITTNTSDQMFPAISGDKIVWTDNRNGNRDIYMYDLTTNTETQITTNTSDQWSPRISGDRIVWQDGRNITNDIYMYDISSNVETRITTNFAGHYSPDIDGDKIVFEEDSDIYVYDIPLQVKTLVTSAANSQYVPRISGDNIVWYDYRLGFASKPDIYLYNLISQTETQITSDGFAQEAPDISGNKIVWADRRGWNQNYDVYVYDLTTKVETQITSNVQDQIVPRISGGKVVWTDYRNSAPGVYVYDLATQSETNVGAFDASYADISGNRIVWMDQRNGNFDVYLYDLNPNVAPAAQIASVPVATLGQPTNFDASGSSDPDGTIASYHWDFGDGSSADSTTANHVYTSAGAYQVTLTVMDDDGAADTETVSVTVNAPPVAVIAPVSNIALSEEATFDGSGSYDPDGTIVSFSWDFGDGTMGNGDVVTHTYAAEGTYQVTLTVTDTDGASHPVSISVDVVKQLTSLSPAQVWVGIKNSDAVGIKFDIKAEVYKDGTLIASGQLDSVPGGSSGFGNARLNTIPFVSFSPVDFPAGSSLSMKVSVRNACVGSGKNSGTARLWFNDSAANSQFGANITPNTNDYYLLDGLVLGTSAGPGPKKNIDVAAGAKCSPFKEFGTWLVTPN